MPTNAKDSLAIAGPIKLPVFLEGGKVGQFMLYYFSLADGGYYALVKGDIKGSENIPVRVHSACNIAHIFGSLRCDCQAQLELAMKRIHDGGKGLLIYVLSHEGRGVGPFDHMRVYQKQDEGLDTVDSYIKLDLPVDSRNYDNIRTVLDFFEVKKIRLLTNNPRKLEALTALGYEVKREPLIAQLTAHNQSQIKAKVERLGHLMPFGGESNG